MKKTDIQVLLEHFLGDADVFVQRYLGTESEDNAFEKLLSLLRNIYKLDSSIFEEDVLSKISSLKISFGEKREKFSKNREKLSARKIEVEGEVGVFSPLPFRVGGIYTDRNNSYVVYKIEDGHMWIEYDDGREEKINLETTIKDRIHSNMISELIDEVEEKPSRGHNEKLVRMILNANINERYISLWVKNLKRESHCYKCSSVVNIECEFCYICGWFMCGKCTACGCGYESYRRSHPKTF